LDNDEATGCAMLEPFKTANQSDVGFPKALIPERSCKRKTGSLFHCKIPTEGSKTLCTWNFISLSCPIREFTYPSSIIRIIKNVAYTLVCVIYVLSSELKYSRLFFPTIEIYFIFGSLISIISTYSLAQKQKSQV
jgi:hypothetical protein